MRLKNCGYTAAELKEIVKTYIIETYERFDFIAETAEVSPVTDTDSKVYTFIRKR